MKQKFYFTFGVGTILANYYLVLEAETEIAARKKIIELLRGNHLWAGCYTQQMWDSFKERHIQYEAIELQVPFGVAEITDYEEKEALKGR